MGAEKKLLASDYSCIFRCAVSTKVHPSFQKEPHENA
jgi:hypothetical protein